MGVNRLLTYTLAIYIASAIIISYLPWGANISQGIGFALAFLFLIEFFAAHRRFLLSRELTLFAIFFVYTLVGGFIAYEHAVFWRSEFTLFQLLGLTFISYNILTNQRNLKLAIKSLIIATIIVGVLPFVGVTPVTGRLASTLVNPNLYGLTLLFSIAMDLYLIAASSRRWEKIFYSLPIPFFVYQIILTGSRKGILGLFVFPTIFYIIHAWRHFRYRPGRLLVGMLILGGILASVWYVVNHSPYYKRLERLSTVLITKEIDVGDLSIKERIDFLKAAYQTWEDHPLFGVGNNQFRFYTDRYIPGLRHSYAHINFLEIAADFGIIGFMLYYSIYASIFLNLYKLKKLTKTCLSTDIFIALMVLFVILELAWVSYLEKITWIVLSIVIAYVRNIGKEYRNRRVKSNGD